jgi:hypothetical protein
MIKKKIFHKKKVIQNYLINLKIDFKHKIYNPKDLFN